MPFRALFNNGFEFRSTRAGTGQSTNRIGAFAAGTTNIILDTIRFADEPYNGVALCVAFGAIANNAVTGVELEIPVAGSTNWTTHKSRSVTDTNDNLWVIVFDDDAWGDGRLEMRGEITRGTANATVQASCYLLYNGTLGDYESAFTDVGILYGS